MMAEIPTVTKLLQKLSIKNEQLETLEELKTFVTTVPSSSFKNTLNPEDLLNLFDCINSEKTEQIENTCFILSILLPILDPLEVISHLSIPLQNGLGHQNHNVKHLALIELCQIITSLDGIRILCESPEIVKRCSLLVGDKEEATALTAVKFLTNLGQASPNAASLILQPGDDSNLNILKQAMQYNSVVRYRVFEIISGIQSESEEMLNLCIKSGILEQLILDIKSDDILSRVTCCDVLADMASSRHTLNYFIQSGVFSTMADLLKEAPSDPLSNLYIPGVVRFFGKLCLCHGTMVVIEIYPKFFQLLFNFLLGGDNSNKQVAIETLGVAGKSFKGKMLLYSEGQNCTNAIKELCNVMFHGAQDIRLRAVNSFCHLLKSDKPNDDGSFDCDAVTLDWFKLISDDPIDSVLTLCKLPFTDLRCSGYYLLEVISGCPWGLLAMVEYPTLTEFLLDRSTETEKKCKEAKFKVVHAISTSPECASIFGNQNYLRFRNFVNEGPLYKEASLSVAIQDE